MKLAENVKSMRFGVWHAIFLVVIALGLYATVVRYAQGLGAATNLSDEFPWGIWIGFDMLVGVGLAAGGFVIAVTVHVFHIKSYEEIARPTILTAFLGYLLVIVALLFDLGQPWRIWHPMVMWNPHSVMFEVGWCVMLYTTVLALEFSPFVLEKLGFEKPLRWVRAIYVPLVIAGALLSTMHQSSLGTLYVIAPDKLHGLWYSPLLPIFFFLSAVAAGLAMTIFESFMSQRAFGKRLEAAQLRGLGRVIIIVLGAYTLWRFEDLLQRGNLGLAFDISPESVMFWGEIGLGALLPMVLFAIPAVRRNPQGLFFASVLAVMGFIVNRMNVAVTGMAASSGVSYFPSWMEFAVTISLVAAGFAAFGLAVRYLPIFPDEPASERAERLARTGGVIDPTRRPVITRPVLAGLWIVLFLGVAAVGYGMAHVRAESERRLAATTTDERLASGALVHPDDYTFPTSPDSPGPVTFRHSTHVSADTPDCAGCHTTTFRLDAPGEPIDGTITYERVHEGDLCATCHDGSAAFAVDDGCDTCHAM